MSVAAVVLAAGRSTRMGSNKMLADLRGEALIRRTLEPILASRARPVIVVTGHEPQLLARAIAGLEATPVHNPRYAQGLSTSLIAGIAAVPETASAALICLGDMPLVGAHLLDRLIAAFEVASAAGAVVPARAGEWGNPVLVGRRLFPLIGDLEGDAGARKLLRGRPDVTVLEVEDASILTDADTPEALQRLRRGTDAALRDCEG